MTLNTASLEAYEEAISGPAQADRIQSDRRTARHFVASEEPGRGPLRADVHRCGRPHGAPATYTATQLAAGIPLELGSLDYIRVELRIADEGVTLKQIQTARRAHSRLQGLSTLARAGERPEESMMCWSAISGTTFSRHAGLRQARDYETATRTTEAMLVQLGPSATFTK